jgi:valyl-tRNA synthetase
MGKISKSRGGGSLPPLKMIERYSADAVRYWAVSTGLGKETLISEDKIKLGAKLVTKLWNVARFSERFLMDQDLSLDSILGMSQTSLFELDRLSPADRWILSRTQRVVRRLTDLLLAYDYAAAKSEVETFFWREFADNYLEMCKQRLYGDDEQQREAARSTLHYVLLTVIQLFAPFLPFITEAIYQELFFTPRDSEGSGFSSIHRSSWPEPVLYL